MHPDKTKVLIIVQTPMADGKPLKVGGIQTRISNYLRLLPSFGIDPFLLSIGPESPDSSIRTQSMKPSPRSFLRFLRFLRKERIQVVHLLEGSISIFPLLLVALSKIYGSKTAVSYYGGEISEALNLLKHRLLLRPSISLADIIISNSKATRNLVPGPKKATSMIVYPGADQAMLSTLDGLEIREKGRGEIIFVGRMGKRKGAVDLVKAFTAVNREMPWTHLTIVGTGPARNIEQLVHETHRHGIENVVNMVGRIDHGDPHLVRLYAEADVFSMPAKDVGNYDVEGFGCVFLEAAMFETPSVATYHFGIPEAIVNGKTGLLVDEGDVASLVKALLKVLRDPNLQKKLGKNAKKRVLSEFTDGNSTRSLAQVYKTVIERSSRLT